MLRPKKNMKKFAKNIEFFGMVVIGQPPDGKPVAELSYCFGLAVACEPKRSSMASEAYKLLSLCTTRGSLSSAFPSQSFIEVGQKPLFGQNCELWAYVAMAQDRNWTNPGVKNQILTRSTVKPNLKSLGLMEVPTINSKVRKNAQFSHTFWYFAHPSAIPIRDRGCMCRGDLFLLT